jgi:hypothetical protein
LAILEKLDHVSHLPSALMTVEENQRSIGSKGTYKRRNLISVSSKLQLSDHRKGNEGFSMGHP